MSLTPSVKNGLTTLRLSRLISLLLVLASLPLLIQCGAYQRPNTSPIPFPTPPEVTQTPNGPGYLQYDLGLKLIEFKIALCKANALIAPGQIQDECKK